jgi:hypothetical protein
VQVLLLPMLKPRSYTREDVVELHCHGGSVCVQRVLSLCLVRATRAVRQRACVLTASCAQRAGARLASPGEFTMRAFMNGARIAVHASTMLFAKTAALQVVWTCFRYTSGSRTSAVAALTPAMHAQAESVQAIIDAQTKEAADSALLALRGAESSVGWQLARC